MNSYNSNTTSLCTYVPLSSYDWKTIAWAYKSCYGISMQFNPVVYCIFAGFHVVTLWICFVLLLKILFTFKSWNTMYFWSLMSTAIGTSLVQIIGDLPILADISSSGVRETINTTSYYLSWIAMACGFSLVLYSRLHLILPNPRLLRIILFIVVGVCGIVQIPPFIIQLLIAKLGPATFMKIAHIISYYEILLSIQEAFLSSLYIYLFVRFMRQGGSRKPKETNRVFYLLVAADITIILCDLISNTLLYMQLYLARRVIYTFMFAIKLRVEFAVLNRLAALGLEKVQLEEVTVEEQIEGSRSMSSTRVECHGLCAYCNSPVLAKMVFSEGSLQHEGLREGLPTSTPISIPLACHCIGTNGKREEERDSMEETERRYLGRFGLDDIV